MGSRELEVATVWANRDSSRPHDPDPLGASVSASARAYTALHPSQLGDSAVRGIAREDGNCPARLRGNVDTRTVRTDRHPRRPYERNTVCTDTARPRLADTGDQVGRGSRRFVAGSGALDRCSRKRRRKRRPDQRSPAASYCLADDRAHCRAGSALGSLVICVLAIFPSCGETMRAPPEPCTKQSSAREGFRPSSRATTARRSLRGERWPLSRAVGKN